MKHSNTSLIWANYTNLSPMGYLLINTLKDLFAQVGQKVCSDFVFESDVLLEYIVKS